MTRELAIELAPVARVNCVAPASVVAGSTMFPRERVITSLKKYEIEFDDSEPDEALRNRLAEFYAQRTLTKKPVVPAEPGGGDLLFVEPTIQQNDRPNHQC